MEVYIRDKLADQISGPRPHNFGGHRIDLPPGERVGPLPAELVRHLVEHADFEITTEDGRVISSADELGVGAGSLA
jgi:hypothetical protein